MRVRESALERDRDSQAWHAGWKAGRKEGRQEGRKAGREAGREGRKEGRAHLGSFNHLALAVLGALVLSPGADSSRSGEYQTIMITVPPSRQ